MTFCVAHCGECAQNDATITAQRQSKAFTMTAAHCAAAGIASASTAQLRRRHRTYCHEKWVNMKRARNVEKKNKQQPQQQQKQLKSKSR